MRCNLKHLLKHGDINMIVEKTGIHRNTIRDYKNENQMPGLDHAYKIAKALNKSIFDIWPQD
jgi:DNA-binding XRE family transcriptional regulator